MSLLISLLMSIWCHFWCPFWGPVSDIRFQVSSILNHQYLPNPRARLKGLDIRYLFLLQTITMTTTDQFFITTKWTISINIYLKHLCQQTTQLTVTSKDWMNYTILGLPRDLIVCPKITLGIKLTRTHALTPN